MNLYLPDSITDGINIYIGWDELRQLNVPDRVWRKVCDSFCQNNRFRESFTAYWNDPNVVNYISNAFTSIKLKEVYPSFINLLTCKEKLLIFLNHLINDTEYSLVPPMLWRDKSFVIYTIRYINIYIDLDRDLQDDQKIKLECIKWYPPIIQQMKVDRTIMFEAIKRNYAVLQYSSETFRDDKEIVLAAIYRCGTMFQFASPRLKADKDIVSIAVKASADTIEYADFTLRSDPEFMLSLMTNKNHRTIFKGATSALQNDPAFLSRMLKYYERWRLD